MGVRGLSTLLSLCDIHRSPETWSFWLLLSAWTNCGTLNPVASSCWWFDTLRCLRGATIMTAYHEYKIFPGSTVHGANMRPTWVLSAQDGPHAAPMNLAIKDTYDGMDCRVSCAMFHSSSLLSLSYVWLRIKSGWLLPPTSNPAERGIFSQSNGFTPHCLDCMAFWSI